MHVTKAVQSRPDAMIFLWLLSGQICLSHVEITLADKNLRFVSSFSLRLHVRAAHVSFFVVQIEKAHLAWLGEVASIGHASCALLRVVRSVSLTLVGLFRFCYFTPSDAKYPSYCTFVRGCCWDLPRQFAMDSCCCTDGMFFLSFSFCKLLFENNIVDFLSSLGPLEKGYLRLDSVTTPATSVASRYLSLCADRTVCGRIDI